MPKFTSYLKPAGIIASVAMIAISSAEASNPFAVHQNSTFIAEISNQTDEAPTGWQRVQFQVIWQGSGVRLDQLGKPISTEAIYSGTAMTPGNVAFVCHGDTLTASIALEPVDKKQMLLDPPSSRRYRLSRPDITIGGERIQNEDWIYMPAMEAYRARKFKSTAKLYNAAVRGDLVSVKHRGETVTLNLPKRDDTFLAFGQACGVGLYGKD